MSKRETLLWTLKVLVKSSLIGSLCGLLVGGGVVAAGAVPQDAGPSEMLLGGTFLFTFLGFALGAGFLALRLLWWSIQVLRGRAPAPNLAVEHRVTAGSTVAGASVALAGSVLGAFLGGLGIGTAGTYWWGMQLWLANPTNPAAHEWAPILIAVECPVAFVLFAVAGGLLGALVGFMGSAGFGLLIATVRPKV